MSSLENQVALVTGGGSGIGLGVVKALIGAGARVGVLELAAAKVQSLNSAFGDRVAAVQGDVTSLADNKRAVAATVKAFGKLDVLICVAGVWDYFAGIVDFPEERITAAFDELFAVNVKANLLSVKAALPSLLLSEGNIILTVSNAGFYPAGGGPLYTSSKFAVRGLVMQLAYELAPKIRVNGVAPGGTSTQLRGLAALDQASAKLEDTPGLEHHLRNTCALHVVPTPEDHAWSYLFLASRENTRTVTGTIIHSDGGLGVRGLTKVSGLDD
jgi:2,3-dihydroxy-2,3-dihydrophenylpropionate dehydrogenase